MSNDPACLAGIKLFVFYNVEACDTHVANMDHFLLDLRKAARLDHSAENAELIADHIERLEVSRAHALAERVRLTSRDRHRA